METKDFKFRIEEVDEDKGTFTGIASVYGVIDTYNESVEKGAFKKTLKDNNGQFPLCWFHDVREPLGVVSASDKKDALKVEGYLNLDVQSAREKRSLVKQGAIGGLSIGFKTIKDEWEKNVRKLKEIQMFEISLITRNFHACPGADILSMKDGIPEEFEPFPNEHSANLRDSNAFNSETFKRTKDGSILGSIKVPSAVSIIWGKLEGKDSPDDLPIPQALRFSVSNWSVAEAKEWLKSNDITYSKFEPATKSLEGVLDRILSIESIDSLSGDSMWLITKATNHLEALLEGKEPLPDLGTLGPDMKPWLDDYLDEFRKLNKSIGG